MVKLVPFLKLYTEYVKSFESASHLLLTWRNKNNTFNKLMTDAEVTLTCPNGEGIPSLAKADAYPSFNITFVFLSKMIEQVGSLRAVQRFVLG